ncbi:hypothetical protein HYH02_014687 [Chlamydomonas schloesseri]|uniref:Uncharacterized protein n=1 Tax=Chlamydomonas schloesseri TaxID=2026947 RepID=A0A835SGZ2_9CHLO|nr:hypothetical protein HYH02_014687 [Chlamydomonas schloesseri]|eukprot:KAG2427042.1 hypothetical protein HYH02_014687 [Chlamydomonas schloesseri]
MDFGKLKSVFLKSHECLEKWLAIQEAGARLLANAGNIIQRLPVLHDRRNYAALPNSQQLQTLVLAKQIRALESVFGRLQENLSEMASVVRAQERLVVEAWKLLGEHPSAAACGAVQCGGASVAQLVECMEDVWRCCRDDLAVRAAALSGLSHTSTPQQFQQLSGALAACTGLGQWSTPVVLMSSVAPVLR